MLSKPKYMLPGNLSQGAPILEPDESNNYNFSFALDGDEVVERVRCKIYSLEPLELAKEDIKLSFDDFYLRQEDEEGNFTEKPLKDYIKLTHIEASLDKERNINFSAKFSFPKNKVFYTSEEKYSKTNFLLPQYPGSFSLNFTITVSNWGVITYKNDTNENFETNSDWWTPLFNIFKDSGKTNKFSTLSFSGTTKIKFKVLEDKIIGFIGEDDILSGKGVISYNNFREEQKAVKPLITIDKKKYNQWAKDRERLFDIVLNNNGAVFNRYDKTYYNKTFTVEEKNVYYLNIYYWEGGEKYYPYTERYPGDDDYSSSDFGKYDSDYGFLDKYWVKKPVAFIFEFSPYNNNYYLIENNTIEISLKKSEQNLFLENEFGIDEMPKNQEGQYNFITFEIPKYLSGSYYDDNSGLTIPPGHYCWGVEILKKNSFNEDEIIATSNYYHFDVLENKKEYGLSDLIAPKTSIIINGIENNNPYLLDYSFEVSSEKVLFYKSPWINSNNSTIIFPFKHFPFEIKYSTTFTTTSLEQKILSENDFFYSLKEYNKTIEFKEENEKISLKSEKEIKNLSIFRVNKNNNKIIFIKKISLEPNIQINIDDIGNNFSEYYYYLINDDTGEWQYSLDEVDEETGEINPVYHLNKNLDKWRLILTKGEKNDIIEEKRMCHYQVDKIYDFYYNLVSGSIGNNAETTVSTNFTSMPSVQKGFSNYWSGSLSALMGVCDEQGEFAQTIEQEKALEQLVLDQEHDKFLLDREGNIWQVEISAPLIITNQDGLVQVDKLIDLKTIIINWVQVGTPTQIVFDFEE